jgi:hypothetical protein
MDQNAENTRDEAITVRDGSLEKHRRRMLASQIDYLSVKHKESAKSLQKEAWALLLTLKKYAFTPEEFDEWAGDAAVELRLSMTEARTRGLALLSESKDAERAA